MALTIKPIPVLTEEEAKLFNQNMQDSIVKNEIVDFTKQHHIATKIIAKSKV
jgi:hypothetical protein